MNGNYYGNNANGFAFGIALVLKTPIKFRISRMKFAIVASKKDEAGMTIAGELEKLGVGVIYLDELSIYADKEVNEKCKNSDFVIFATKHESEKKMPALTVHAPGNWGNADYGGENGRVCKTSGMFMKLLFNILKDEAEKQKLGGYEITMECTHHGPLIDKPCCFIEIGSSYEEWNDSDAGNVVAMTIKRAINNIVVLDKDYEAVVGVGGPHYCPNFNKIQLNSEYAVGHVIPQYVFPLTKEMVREAVGGTFEKVKKVIIDWKGCGVSAERERVIGLLEGDGLEVVRSDKVGK